MSKISDNSCGRLAWVTILLQVVAIGICWASSQTSGGIPKVNNSVFQLAYNFITKEESSLKGGLLLAEAREALRIDVNKTRYKFLSQKLTASNTDQKLCVLRTAIVSTKLVNIYGITLSGESLTFWWPRALFKWGLNEANKIIYKCGGVAANINIQVKP